MSMRKNVFWKSILRHPVQTIFLLLLIGFISFVFTSRATEYLVIQQETDRIGKYYRSIGIVEPLSQYDTVIDAAEAERLLRTSAYVDFVDTQRVYSGTLRDTFNIAFGGMVDMSSDVKTFVPYNPRTSMTEYGDVIICGELMEYAYGGYYIRLRVDQVEAAYPEYAHTSNGKAAGFIVYYGPEVLEQDAGGELVIGQRYMVRGRFTGDFLKLRSDLVLLPLNYELAEDEADWIWILPLDTEAGTPIDYSIPGFEGLQDYVSVLLQNQKAMSVVSSRDMSYVPDVMEFYQRIQLSEGRLLDYDDYINQNPVCVVPALFANTRGYAVGDILTLDIRDFNNPYSNGGVVVLDDPLWETYPIHTLDLEIVGLYNVVAGGSSGTVYVPESIMPGDWGKLLGISLSLSDMKHEDSFLEKYVDELAMVGMSVHFLPNDADDYWECVAPLRKSALINALIFAFLLILALVLAVFLYLRGRRRIFAILRALGTPKAAVIRMSAIALSAVGILAIAAGGAASWNYALDKARQSLSALALPKNVQTSASMSILWLFLICACVFLLLAAFTVAGATLTARHPVLELLQGGAARVKKEKSDGDTTEMAEIPQTGISINKNITNTPAKTAAVSPTPAEPLQTQGNRGSAARRRYMFRHMRRSGVKSCLSIIIAAVSVVALGWMSRTIERNKAEIDYLYDTTVIQAGIVAPESPTTGLIISGEGNPSIRGNDTENLITNSAVNHLLYKRYTTDMYLEKNQDFVNWSVITTPDAFPEDYNKRIINKGTMRGIQFWGTGRKFDGIKLSDISIIGINNVKTYFTSLGLDIRTEYAAGYDEKLFALQDTIPYPIVLPRALMDELGVALGDEVLLIQIMFENISVSNSYITNTESTCVVAGAYWDAGGNLGADAPALMPIEVMAAQESRIWSVAGLPYRVYYSKALFTLKTSVNRELNSLRTSMNNTMMHLETSRTALRFMVWDEELRKVVDPLESSLRLMSILYPITIAASVLIAAGLAVLIMFQSALDAAIMRVLGSAKQQVRFTFCSERVILCLAGLLLGFAVLLALNGWAVSALLKLQPLVCAGLYLAGELAGSVTGAILITRRTPLELLQVKE